jgi:hypothetical protein
MTQSMRRRTYAVAALAAPALVVGLLAAPQSADPLVTGVAAAQSDPDALDPIDPDALDQTDPDALDSVGPDAADEACTDAAAGDEESSRETTDGEVADDTEGEVADDTEGEVTDDTEGEVTDDTAGELGDDAATDCDARSEAGSQANESLRDSVRAIGDRNVSFDLRLEQASIEQVDLDSDEREFVRFQFGTTIDRVVNQRAFMLIGLDPNDVVTSEVAFRDEEDLDSVLVGFPARTDVFSYTLASTAAGAVETVAQEGNIPDSIALQGSNIGTGDGRTTGPDLINVDIEPSLERAVYVFDEQLDERQTPSASSFGYYTLSGIDPRGSQIVSVEDNTVTVRFAEDRGDQIEDAVRLWVAAGAARDTAGNASPVGVVGDLTTAPDLQAIEDGPGQTQFDFVFDDQVTDANPSAFAVYTADGTRYSADSVTRPDGNRVRAAFPEIEEFGDEIVLASADREAVHADRGFDTPNTVGAVAIRTDGVGAGRTTGPDLTGVQLDPTTGQAELTFDEAIDDDEVYDVRDLLLITATGRMVTAEAIVESHDRTMIVTFRPNVAQAARGLTINTGGVRDFQDNGNPLDTLNL